jgi:isoleucyl-tRNA synthetase
MDEALEIVSAGHKLRDTAGIKVRQVLQAIYIPERLRLEHFEDYVREELNVKNVIYFTAEVGSKEDVLRLDTHLTPELLAEGAARDFIRVVQVLRKDAGLQVTDRINLTVNWRGNNSLKNQVNLHHTYVSRKLLIGLWCEVEDEELSLVEMKGNPSVGIKVEKC